MSSNRRPREPRILVEAANGEGFSVRLSALLALAEKQVNAGHGEKNLSPRQLERCVAEKNAARKTDSTPKATAEINGTAEEIVEYLSENQIKIRAGRHAAEQIADDDFSDLEEETEEDAD